MGNGAPGRFSSRAFRVGKEAQTPPAQSRRPIKESGVWGDAQQRRLRRAGSCWSRRGDGGPTPSPIPAAPHERHLRAL